MIYPGVVSVDSLMEWFWDYVYDAGISLLTGVRSVGVLDDGVVDLVAEDEEWLIGDWESFLARVTICCMVSAVDTSELTGLVRRE